MELKSLEDWALEKQFKPVPDVVDVVSLGGTKREYQVKVDPDKLVSCGLSIGRVEQQLVANNVNAGGSFLEEGLQQINVRALGLIRDVHGIERIVVKTQNGAAIRVAGIAQVAQGPKIRLGQMGKAYREGSSRHVAIKYSVPTRDSLRHISSVCFRTHRSATDAAGCYPHVKVRQQVHAAQQRRRQQAQAGHQNGHRDRPQPLHRTLGGRFPHRQPARPQLVDVLQHDHADLHRNAEQRQEAHTRGLEQGFWNVQTLRHGTVSEHFSDVWPAG